MTHAALREVLVERTEETAQPIGAPATVEEPVEGPSGPSAQASEQPSGPPPAPPEGDAPEPPPFVYALGRIEPRFRSLAVEKEFSQVVGQNDNRGLTDRQALRAVITEPANRYLVRELCWVFLIEGLETYVLVPRDSRDLDLLAESVRPEAGGEDIDVVIGRLGPVAPPEACDGLGVPIVVFDQLYSFDRGSLVESIPRPDSIPQKQFRSAAGEVFDRIMQMTDTQVQPMRTAPSTTWRCATRRYTNGRLSPTHRTRPWSALMCVPPASLAFGMSSTSSSPTGTERQTSSINTSCVLM
jgi:hypothetical protein